jgi:hypothetical protein
MGDFGWPSGISYEDVHDFNHYRMDPWGANSSVEWVFDITDGSPWDPNAQEITSASVTLKFSDVDDGWFDWFEFATLDVGTNSFFWEVDNGNVGFAVTSLMTLSNTGRVDATLTARWGDFYFDRATLYADGTELDPSGGDAPAPVPEPSTILLMGTGILGLVAYGRKRYNKKA